MPEEMALITQNYKEMQQIMSNYVGIVRSKPGGSNVPNAGWRLSSRRPKNSYSKLTLSQDLCELRDMIAVGYLIIKHAEALHQSIGLHYSTDHPPARSNDNNG